MMPGGIETLHAIRVKQFSSIWDQVSIPSGWSAFSGAVLPTRPGMEKIMSKTLAFASRGLKANGPEAPRKHSGEISALAAENA
jgi:hypothetical protein